MVDLGWQSHVADLAALFRHWQSGPLTLVGHSWGSLLALLFAAAYPDSVARMVLVAPAPVTARHRIAYLRRLSERIADPEIESDRLKLEQSGLRTSDPTAYRRRGFALSIIPYLRDRSHAVNVEPFMVSTRVKDAVWRSLGSYDVSMHAEGLSVPALVVHGLHDPIPLESSQQIAATLDCPLEIFENCGHLPFVEEAKRFFEVVDGFLPRDEE